MNRRAVSALVLVVTAVGAAAQHPSLEGAREQMGVEFLLPEGAETTPLADQADVVVQVAFAYPGAGYEVRCAFLPDGFLSRECRGGDVDRYVPVFAVGVFACIARDGLPAVRMSELPPESVRREFRADSGLTALLPGMKCDFSRGYRYVVANVLYRRQVGVVIVYLLYNDPADLGMDGQRFTDAYYCFMFAE